MKKILAISIALVMMSTIIPSVFGGESDTIAITMNPNETADIAVNITSIAATNLNSNTTRKGVLTNEGSVQVDVAVNTSVTTDETTWALSTNGDLAGVDNGEVDKFSFWYAGDSDIGYIDVAGTNIQINDFAYDGAEYFNISIIMPQYSTTNTMQHVNVTFTATVD